MSEGIRKYEIMDRLNMQQQLQALRDEVARLRGALQTIATWDARSTSQRIQTFAKAALTPQGGKGGGE